MSDIVDSIVLFCKERINHSDNSGVIHMGNGSVVHEIGIEYSHLTKDQVRGLAVGLSHSMIKGRMGLYISTDIYQFWNSVSSHLLEPPSLYFNEDFGKPFPVELSYLRNLFVTVARTATEQWRLAEYVKKDDWMSSRIGLIEPANYFVFPLLEAILKRCLSEYVSLDGTVIKTFNLKGWEDPFKANGRRKISQVRQLFMLLIETNKYPDLSSDLEQIFSLLNVANNGKDAIEVISDWRNPVMHGSDYNHVAAPVLLNIIILIAIADISDEKWLSRYD